MFLRYGNARDYYSLCGFMNLTLLNLCEFVRACRGSSIRLAWSDANAWFWTCACLYMLLCMWCAHRCIFLKVEKLRTSISGRECAATVDGASERANYSCVICFGSRLKQPNHPTISVTGKKPIKLLSSGSANKHKLTMNECPQNVYDPTNSSNRGWWVVMVHYGARSVSTSLQVKKCRHSIHFYAHVFMYADLQATDLQTLWPSDELKKVGWRERQREGIPRPYPGPAPKYHAKGQMQWFYANGL